MDCMRKWNKPMGTFINAKTSENAPKRYHDMTPLEKAKADMDYAKKKGGIAYKQAKAHYEKLKKKEERK